MHIADDKVVSFHFTLTNDQGEVIESSRSQAPLTYLHGHGHLLASLEKALAGKASGEKFAVTLAPEEAYGQYDQALVQMVERSVFPGNTEIQVGMQFVAEFPNGERVFTITDIEEDRVTIDGNHPLAGETLSFDIEIVEIRDATEEELTHGHAHGPGGHRH